MQKLCNKKGRIVVAAAMLMSLFLELLSPAVTVSAQVADSVNTSSELSGREVREGTGLQPYTGVFSSNQSLTSYGGGSADYSHLSDGNSDTFICFSSGVQKGDWLQMDLEGVYPVDSVCVLVGDKNNSSTADKWVKYHLEYSVDGEKWFRFSASTGAAGGMDTYTVDLNGMLARYIKLVCEDEPKAPWVRFS